MGDKIQRTRKHRNLKRQFERSCEDAGGDYREHESERPGGSAIEFLGCRFDSMAESPQELEGNARSIQLRLQRGDERPTEFDVKPGASVSVRGRANATIRNPKRVTTEYPDEMAKRSAEEVGVPARKKIKIEGEQGNLVLNGEPSRRNNNGG